MTVLYDTQIFDFQTFGGVSRFYSELIRNLDPDIKYRLPLWLSNSVCLNERDITKHHYFFRHSSFTGKRTIITTVNRFAFRLASCKSFDVFHPTMYNPFFLKHIGNHPFVLTVYDMIYELYPKQFASIIGVQSRNKRLLCEKATVIIAVSQNTKNDLVNIFGINPDKIQVVYEGQSLVPTDAKSMNLPQRYILFTGQRGGYKNFERFAEAFAIVAAKDKDIQLICTGPKWKPAEIALLQSLKITERVQCMYVSDAQIAELYARAQLFVFPSEYEGFGLPTLEAFACGCPVVLSNASCFPEVAGDAGLYFDPHNVEDIADKIKHILSSEAIRRDMIEKGKKQLSLFSFAKMGKEISEIYRNIVR